MYIYIYIYGKCWQALIDLNEHDDDDGVLLLHLLMGIFKTLDILYLNVKTQGGRH